MLDGIGMPQAADDATATQKDEEQGPFAGKEGDAVDIASEASAHDSKDGTTHSTRAMAAPASPKQTTQTISQQDTLKASPRPTLQSKATTAVSKTDIRTPEAPRSGIRTLSRQPSAKDSLRVGGHRVLDLDDNASIRSYSPSMFAAADVESLLGDILDRDEPAYKPFLNRSARPHRVITPLSYPDRPLDYAFASEFEDLEAGLSGPRDEEALSKRWHAKLKHFLIFSSAGKPIYTRHGSDSLISSTIGIAQTIIATFQSQSDTLRSFEAGSTRFVILSQGHLHLLASSRLHENESQLSNQLESLYMQILSSLTLPKLTHMFLNRPSMDLRRPLAGTETLLSALSDSFTRGSPSTLLSSLECLRLRKSHRQVIDSSFLKCRRPSLLYGLLVASGQLVSVLRPKKHSLHPGDLQLVFNMLFSAGAIRASGGENWIPLCLPGFNNTGYLHMYVKFRDALAPFADDDTRNDDRSGIQQEPSSEASNDSKNDHNATPSPNSHEIATVLISTSADAFPSLREMDNQLINDLDKNGSLSHICAAIQRGRSSVADVLAPASVENMGGLWHFLYKSRTNVQFVMPKMDVSMMSINHSSEEDEREENPGGEKNDKSNNSSCQRRDEIIWRRTMTVYAKLHNAIHSKKGSGGGSASSLKMHTVCHDDYTAVACVASGYEVYCIGSPPVVDVPASTTTLEQAEDDDGGGRSRYEGDGDDDVFGITSNPSKESRKNDQQGLRNTGGQADEIENHMNALREGAARVITWAKREGERLFIVGGAVF